MKTKLLPLCVALVCATHVLAYDCLVDGIYYNLNNTDKTAEVTSGGGYSGTVNIPASITYNSQTYSVTMIGEMAFYGCSGLTSVTIPNSVTTIGEKAFSYCSGLTSVTIGNSVTTIGDYAFSGCSGLPVIDNIRYADTYLVEAVDKSLDTYNIQDGTKWIGEDAFEGCKLTSIVIPNSVTTIGDWAFYDCSGLPVIDNIRYADTYLVEAVDKSLDTYNIQDGTKWIGDGAFSYCSGLTSVTIPNSVTTIGSGAFWDCSGLTSVTIPNSVTTIGSGAFWDCSGLTSVTIPNSVTTIGNSAFWDCSGLTSVTIGNSVTMIEYFAFESCSNLKSITWNAIKYEGHYYDSPFSDIASQITSFTFGDKVEIIPGELCADMNQLTSVTIPNSVTVIGNDAFIDCTGLTSIEIPNSVTVIGNDAFKDCSSIQSVTWNAKNCNGYNFGSQVESFVFGDSVEVIPNDICKGMNKLLTIIIPNSVTTIGGSAFEGCSGLTSVTIPSSVTTIEWAAFSYCSGLTSVTIPNSVTTIGDYTFRGCSGLTSVTIPNSVTTIGENAFRDCSGLTSVTIPNSVTTIGSEAFYGCSNLKSITWNAINYGGDDYSSYSSPFSNIASQITSFTFGDKVETIPSSLCSGMSQLTSITIPESVTTIGYRAFYNCSGLTSVTIPNSVTTIGDYAFYLVNNIVYNGTATGSPWGAKCVNGYIDGYFVYSDATKTTLCGCSSAATGEITIPNSVTTIGENAFRDCSGLTSVTIPNSVTTIGVCTFYGCSGLTKTNYAGTIADWCKIKFGDFDANPIKYSHNFFINDVEIKDLVIPDGVTTIGEMAFSNCSGLTSVTIPNSVTTIGDGAFEGCSGLTKTNYAGTIADWCKIKFGDSDANPIKYSHNFFINDVEIKDLVIPDGVTTIGERAFENCSGLTSVTIPNSVTTIGEYAFSGCSGLPVIDNIRYADTYLVEAVDKSLDTYNIQDGTKWIGSSAFEGCKLTSIVIPNSVTTIGYYAFRDCWKLTDITLPNSVTTIGDGAFSWCSGLTHTNYIGTIADWCKIKFESALSNPFTYSHTFYINGVEIKDLVIPEGIDTIGDYTFRGCSGLTSVTIPNSVTTIGDYAFSDCSGLTSIEIPNSVTTIGSAAFANNSHLTDVVIGANVTKIGCNAFANDYRLENITCYAPIAPNVCSTTFGNLDKSVIYLYVPADYQRVYQEDSDWKDFDLHLIGAKQQPISTDTIIVMPSADNATFTWPANEQADSYLLEITKDGVVFCTLTFNAIGQLTGIAFVPSRDGEAHTMAAATMTASGWQFTVTGLNQASKYAYTMDVKNASQKSIKTYTGVFVTDGYTDLEAVEGSQFTDSPVHQFTKYVKDGRLLIEYNGIRYSVQGTKIK